MTLLVEKVVLYAKNVMHLGVKFVTFGQALDFYLAKITDSGYYDDADSDYLAEKLMAEYAESSAHRGMSIADMVASRDFYYEHSLVSCGSAWGDDCEQGTWPFEITEVDSGLFE